MIPPCDNSHTGNADPFGIYQVKVYRRADLGKVRQAFSAKRAQSFYIYTQAKPNESGHPIMLVWPREIFRYGREADAASPQALARAWLKAVGAIPDDFSRLRALCLPLDGVRGFENVISLQSKGGDK